MHALPCLAHKPQHLSPSAHWLRTCVTTPFWPLARAAVIVAYEATETPLTPAMLEDVGASEGGGDALAVSLADPRRVAAYGPEWAERVATAGAGGAGGAGGTGGAGGAGGDGGAASGVASGAASGVARTGVGAGAGAGTRAGAAGEANAGGAPLLPPPKRKRPSDDDALTKQRKLEALAVRNRVPPPKPPPRVSRIAVLK